MAEPISLRDYQRGLSAQLADLQTLRPASKLGILAGTRRWLVDLIDTGEVIPVPTIATVPLTRAWYAGVANVRRRSATAFASSRSWVTTTAAEPVPLDLYVLMDSSKSMLDPTSAGPSRRAPGRSARAPAPDPRAGFSTAHPWRRASRA